MNSFNFGASNCARKTAILFHCAFLSSLTVLYLLSVSCKMMCVSEWKGVVLLFCAPSMTAIPHIVRSQICGTVTSVSCCIESCLRESMMEKIQTLISDLILHADPLLCLQTCSRHICNLCWRQHSSSLRLISLATK